MNTFDIILLSIGLAMDCLAVSVSTGISYKKFDTAEAIKMPVMFGLFIRRNYRLRIPLDCPCDFVVHRHKNDLGRIARDRR